MARAAVIALLAALAVLIHHETVAAAIGPTSSSAAHAMTPGMVMADSHPTPATNMSAHAHGSTAAQGAEPTAAVPAMNRADGLACSGMAMQHCSTASFEVVNLAPPAQTPVPWGLTATGAVTAGPKSAGNVDRAPPDLSVLSQLRI
ncbi:hypothetical protein [Streptomyces sp. NPDC057301]|uniref:hypothetical protein n=1 Tax=Streptomyces sp. NPDC057301 TaxID=3346093 RepID=UPI0036269310